MSENPGYLGVGLQEPVRIPTSTETPVEEHARILGDAERSKLKNDQTVDLADKALSSVMLDSNKYPSDHGYHL